MLLEIKLYLSSHIKCAEYFFDPYLIACSVIFAVWLILSGTLPGLCLALFPFGQNPYSSRFIFYLGTFKGIQLVVMLFRQSSFFLSNGYLGLFLL